ncbi:hypothetical protein V7183_09085 [Bacillus sp. JJ1127]
MRSVIDPGTGWKQDPGGGGWKEISDPGGGMGIKDPEQRFNNRRSH